MMLTLSGCGSSTGVIPHSKTKPSDACDFLSPITYADGDTQATIDQILEYDRIYEALCK